MGRPRGLNINLNDLLAARLMADGDEITAPELGKRLKIINGYGLIDRLHRAGWVERTRLSYGPSSFCLSRRGHGVLQTTLIMIRTAVERLST